MPNNAEQESFSLRRLRNIILLCLVVGVAAYTAVMFTLTGHLARRFGPQVRIDLEWRVQRGAQELARGAELGLVIGDRATLERSFGVYATSADVLAIVGVDLQGNVVGKHGKSPVPIPSLFEGPPRGIREGNGYLISWAPAEIEGATVGKIAVVVSTNRLVEARALLARAKTISWLGGAAALLLGMIVVLFFTRAVAQRDDQLRNYAGNLARMVEERTSELDERNRGMRLVLDNVAQGFITIDPTGLMASERSAVVDRWFGRPAHGATLTEYLRDIAPTYTQWLEIGLEQLREDFMPLALVLDQLPKRFTSGIQTFDVAYTPILMENDVKRLLVIFSDVTAQLARERADAEQKELVALFQRISVDRPGVENFLNEAAALVAALRSEDDPVIQKRLVHTLKGNCSIYGLETFAELAHTIENDLAETGAGLSDAQRRDLVSMWKQAMHRVGFLLGGARRDVVELEKIELAKLAARIRSGAKPAEVSTTLIEWTKDSVEQHLERLARQATALARRLNKPEPQVIVEAHGVRLDPGGWAPYWSAMIHVVRNAVDHGIEDAVERSRAFKPEVPVLRLHAERRGGTIVIKVSDDGRGIDWERVRAKAAQLGLPHAEHEDLIEALFHDGLSTRETATVTSGRGVGLGALRASVKNLGGHIEVDSKLGQGTEFRFFFNESLAAAASVDVAHKALESLLPAAS